MIEMDIEDPPQKYLCIRSFLPDPSGIFNFTHDLSEMTPQIGSQSHPSEISGEFTDPSEKLVHRGVCILNGMAHRTKLFKTFTYILNNNGQPFPTKRLSLKSSGVRQSNVI